MAFIKEFLGDFIKRTLMEDPLKRREWRNKHVADMSEKAAALKASWALPSKVPGFWREDSNNAGYLMNLTPSLSRAPGRRDPY